MKAIVQKKYGGPEVLQLMRADTPSPAIGQVLVKVIASGVNRTDCANLRAKPFIMRLVNGLFRPRKKIPGTTFAGQVAAIGEGVLDFSPGDEVFGFDDSGAQSLAEFLVFPEKKAIGKIPEGISHEWSAAAIEGAHYAINFLNKVDISPGQQVLVNGATGAIGSAAVQLLHNAGVRVTAICPGQHAPLVKSLGAEETIDYTREDFTKCGKVFDYIFDTVGKSSFGKCKPLLKPGGAYISSELGWMAQNLFYSLTTSLFSNKKVKFPVPLQPKKSVLTIADLMGRGKFRPLVDRTYPLSKVAEAFSYAESGNKLGNIIVHLR